MEIKAPNISSKGPNISSGISQIYNESFDADNTSKKRSIKSFNVRFQSKKLKLTRHLHTYHLILK